jgi:acyl CoA:acetate/3-ketoacid CoA transferase beta subunit
VFDIVHGKLILVERAEEYSLEDILNATEAEYTVSPNLKVF